MEEKKPLESRSLTHTSKEPEGQSWAQIGTAAYDPPISKSASSSSTTTEKLNNGGVASDEGSNSAQEESTAKASQPEKNSSDGIGDEASDLELHVDVNAEPSQAEATEKEAAEVEDKKKDATENRKRSILGDGFESKLEDEKSEESRSRRDRSRSRSRDRDRDRRSWRDVDRTNSNDPRSVRSRVFVGHLNTADSECSREAMEKLFSPFGKVMGINLQNGYGFVQFEEEDFAKAAIKELHGITFCGTKIGKFLPSEPVYYCIFIVHVVVDRPVALRKMDGKISKRCYPISYFVGKSY